MALQWKIVSRIRKIWLPLIFKGTFWTTLYIFFHFTVDSAIFYFIIFSPKCTLNLRYGELFYKKFVKMFRKIFHSLGRDRGLVPYRNVGGGECVGKYFFCEIAQKKYEVFMLFLWLIVGSFCSNLRTILYTTKIFMRN